MCFDVIIWSSSYVAAHIHTYIHTLSGAVVSMPGMMDTVLSLGINDEVAASLAEKVSQGSKPHSSKAPVPTLTALSHSFSNPTVRQRSLGL